jgi:hypothetical protein
MTKKIVKSKTKVVSSPTKKIIEKKSDFDINQEKIENLLHMLNAHEKPRLTFWRDESMKGDIIGIVPVTRTTKKTIGGQFNPFDEIKEEEFVKFYCIKIKIIESDLNHSNIPYKKFLKNGIIYLEDFDIEKIYYEVVNNL